MANRALRQTDLALRRAILTQQHALGRGLWVLRASVQTAFLAAMLSAAFQIVNSFRGHSGNRELMLRWVLLSLSEAMLRIPIGLTLALALLLAYRWLTSLRDALIADAHSTRLELLSHLAHRTH